MPKKNHLGQPIGPQVPGWRPARPPDGTPMEGRFVRLVRVDPASHAEGLFDAYSRDAAGANWTYLPDERPTSVDATKDWLARLEASTDPFFFTAISRDSGQPTGVASFLRMQPAVGVIEVGFITFSPLMQRSPMSTEAMHLMMARVFDDWGYRRYEWKCDALNAPSWAAAERLGFGFEGIFRQATIYKGRNRDTAWFSVLDREWPALKAAFRGWLDPDNFDDDGRQRRSLASFR